MLPVLCAVIVSASAARLTPVYAATEAANTPLPWATSARLEARTTPPQTLCALDQEDRGGPAGRSERHNVELHGGRLSALLVDNEGSAGSGFSQLRHADFPERSLFSWVGLNFEHVFNGVLADDYRSGSTPRNDPCHILVHSASSASLVWPAEGSSWGLACEMRFALSGANCVDIDFTITPTRPDIIHHQFHPPYVAMMWASYLELARDRSIHFYGTDGKNKGWMALGQESCGAFEQGAISCYGVPPLPWECNANAANLGQHFSKKFLSPFYYGLVDGDGDPATADDTMVFIMMFDQRQPIRFAMWNFFPGADGKADPHRPAWDWQFIVRNPRVGKTYGYKARLVYKRFVSPQDVRHEYLHWLEEQKQDANPRP